MAGPNIKGTRAEAVTVTEAKKPVASSNMNGKPPIKGARVPAASTGGTQPAFPGAAPPFAKRGKY